MIKKITILMAVLGAMLMASSPAMAQSADFSDDDVIDDDSFTLNQIGNTTLVVGDVNTQFSQNVVGDVSVSASQVSTGSNVGGGDDLRVISQSQETSVSVFQSSAQFLNTGFFGIYY